MPKAIVLSQYFAPSAPSGVSEAGTSLLRTCYRALDDSRQRATVDYAADLADAPAQDSTPPPPGTARYVCAQCQDSGGAREPHRVLMIVAFEVPRERCEEVERWYREEHGPMLLRAPGWLRMRRYRLQHGCGGRLWTHWALHELRNAAVLDSAERRQARSTAWRARLEQEPWFTQAGRFVYEVAAC
jgi:hypothetical protein